jgi:hypothetical protein
MEIHVPFSATESYAIFDFVPPTNSAGGEENSSITLELFTPRKDCSIAVLHTLHCIAFYWTRSKKLQGRRDVYTSNCYLRPFALHDLG